MFINLHDVGAQKVYPRLAIVMPCWFMFAAYACCRRVAIIAHDDVVTCVN